ncbi:MAG: Spo0E family sporulation regulatory protein-aspartic acid phosphatase [Anaerovoracaceae bacterium]|jgi:hypothetical protein
MDNKLLEKIYEIQAGIDLLRSTINKLCNEDGNNQKNTDLLALSHQLDKLIVEYMNLSRIFIQEPNF